MKPLALILLLTLTAITAAAQEEDDVERSSRPILATVISGSRVHRSPGGPSIGTLAAGAEVSVAGIANGWLRIRGGQVNGWVDRRFLRAKDSQTSFAPRSFVRFQHGDHSPCAADLAHCQPIGCATDDPTHALFNEVKRGPGGDGPPTRLTLATFNTLQSQATQLVGEAAELTAAERTSIRSLTAGNATTGEGHLVAVAGFIVGAPPHANSGESVNCNLTTKDANDFHVSLAQAASQTAFQSIVIEMIPQNRNPGWTLTKLKDIETRKKRVMVTGQLFYDNAHRVNKNPQHNLTGEPKRFSLWEVHPIRQFFVCLSASCSVNNQSQWTKLEDMPEPH